MAKNKLMKAILAATVISLGVSACAETSTRESAGQYVDSSIITTKVKSALAKDDILSVFKIEVETYKDVVQLSGFVNNAAEKSHASYVAQTVEGVKSVRNDLVVKPKAGS